MNEEKQNPEEPQENLAQNAANEPAPDAAERAITPQNDQANLPFELSESVEFTDSAAPTKAGLSSGKVLLMLVGILAVVGLTIGGTVVVQNMINPTQNSQSPTPEPGTEGEEPTEISQEEVRQILLDLPRRDPADPLSLGAVDAPVVMLAYADYRCPHCINFAIETLPIIIDEYVDSGQLRIEWRDLPVLGDQSVAAALAAQSSANQGKYWEYHDALIEVGNSDPSAVFTQEFLIDLAKQVGVEDLTTFENDLAADETFERVQADYNEGLNFLGFNSTPSFVVGGIGFIGAQPIEAIRQFIDKELELAQ